MNTVHIDIYAGVNGSLYHIGHGDVAQTVRDEDQGGEVANLLHKIAWGMEDHDESARDEPLDLKPRLAKSKMGDLFFEVRPDQFVLGMSLQDAQQSFEIFGGASRLEDLRKNHPGLIVEEIT